MRKHKGISEEMAADAMTDVSYFGTMMVYQGKADGMVSGAVHTTAHTIRPSFEIIKTKPGCSIVSSVFLMCLADRVLVYGDCAVNPNPNSEQLARKQQVCSGSNPGSPCFPTPQESLAKGRLWSRCDRQLPLSGSVDQI